MPSRPETPGEMIVRQVREKGVTDPRVLEALARVPRSRFIPPEKRGQALEDRAVEIGLEQTISQPFIVAVMTAELDLTGTERVLEIGTGSGYQAAVLAHLADEVFTVERFAELSLRARGVLDGLGLTNLRYRIGDGTLGWPEEAPFDRIIVTAAAPRMSPSLFSQLAEGGWIVAPIGNDQKQQITVITKRRDRPSARQVLDCRFVKLIGEEGWHEGH
jgi:protein-L-isoaspartate(D-aspartate) O-methyltransferase